ncbi:MAG: hypothetical protein NC095_10445 [Muribaculum sp.]|nr:hypothetical protein [Muribaculum sp.]
MKFNKTFASLLCMACAICFYSCSDNDDPKPSLQSPTVTETAGAYNSLTFEWNDVANAVQYGYRLSNTEGIAVDAGVTHSKAVTITGLEPATTYTLEVWAFASMDGDYSTPPAVTLTATTDPLIKLSTPTGLTLTSDNGYNYTATWEAVSNANEYSYSVKDSYGETVVSDNTTSTTVELKNLANGDYTFTVYAAGYDGYESGESATGIFNVDKPETPLYTVKGTYYSVQLDSSWTACMDAYADGTYSIKAFYGVEGYNLDFKVDTSTPDDMLSILTGEQVYDESNGYYTWQVPTGVDNPSILMTYPWYNYSTFEGNESEVVLSIGLYYDGYESWGYDEFYWSTGESTMTVDDLVGTYNCHFNGYEYLSDYNNPTYYDDTWTDWATVTKVSDNVISIDGLFYTEEPVTGTVDFSDMSIVFDIRYDYAGWYMFVNGDDPESPALGHINADGSISVQDWGLWYNFGTESEPDWACYLYGTTDLTKSSTSNLARKSSPYSKKKLNKNRPKSQRKVKPTHRRMGHRK